MKIIIITQDDPFFLKQAINRLLIGLPPEANIIACVVSKVSPFGKKENFLHKAIKTYKIFGFYFFARYSLKYLINKFIKTNSVKKLLIKKNIKIIELKSNINSEDSLNIIKENNPDLLISHALAAQFLGRQMLYIESGSGAKTRIHNESLKMVSNEVDIDIIVGGGIKTPEDAYQIANAGASFVVIGSAIEKSLDSVSDFAQAIHK